MNIRNLISLLHIFFIGPLLVFIGNTYGNLPKWGLMLVMVTGFVVAGYHSYLVYKRGGVSNGFIYLLHAVVFAPLLIYVGFKGTKAFWGAYSVLMMIGFAAIGYHLKKIVDRL